MFGIVSETFLFLLKRFLLKSLQKSFSRTVNRRTRPFALKVCEELIHSFKI